MNLFTRPVIRVCIAVTAATAALVPAAALASASPSDPTVGDTVRYVFYSDYQSNESLTYFDADNEIQTMENPTLPSDASEKGWHYGSLTLTSRSTYQLAGSSIQTSGYRAACRVYVNDTLVASDSASGRYAVAIC
ncbi:hypothetical protein L5G28_14730 [Gordonia sp. HY285]|uniref:hypothetical protein n=1 Tax=Gordonia liuliyuniae TaxID=2911517 RepID=UPI001F21B9A5|nr:hypothetical protein [Gordonia liuliyuniae]MCF8611401.1 hypothetical protein [Gordonia liuliyuniae]